MRCIFLTASLFLIEIASPVSACLNDREVETSEQVFVSTYLQPPMPAPVAEGLRTHPLGVAGLLIGGSLLLGTVCILRRRQLDAELLH